MKAILVVDMPENCRTCPFAVYDNYCPLVTEEDVGVKAGEMWKEIAKANNRPDWCPLRELQGKMTEQEAFNMLEKIPNRILLSVLKKEAKQIDDMILTAQASLLNDIPEKVIKTDIYSQSCPACHSPVNGSYCQNCGKALVY